MGSFFFLHFAGPRIESQASCKISKDGQFGPGIELQTSTLSFERKCTVYGLIFCVYESTNVGSRYNNDCATRSLLYDGANTTQESICKSYTPGWSKQLRGFVLPSSCSVTLLNSSQTGNLEMNSIWLCCSSLHYRKGKLFLGT